MTGLPHRKSTEVKVGHWLSTEIVGHDPVRDGAVYEMEYAISQLTFPSEGPEKEVVNCPHCGDEAFEVRRETALYTRWSDCDQELREWIWVQLEDTITPYYWAYIGGVVLLLSTAYGAYGVAYEFGLLEPISLGQPYHSLPSDVQFISLFIAAIIAFFSYHMTFMPFGIPDRKMIETRDMPTETLFWISESSGAPIQNHAGICQHVVQFGVNFDRPEKLVIGNDHKVFDENGDPTDGLNRDDLRRSRDEHYGYVF